MKSSDLFHVGSFKEKEKHYVGEVYLQPWWSDWYNTGPSALNRYNGTKYIRQMLSGIRQSLREGNTSGELHVSSGFWPSTISWPQQKNMEP